MASENPVHALATVATVGEAAIADGENLALFVGGDFEVVDLVAL
ncbi:MAG: hypothetical protein U1F68_10560 [Gammaproteobacteria bacterium]